MKKLALTLSVCSLLLAHACLRAEGTNFPPASKTVLVASTPGDSLIKSMLAIPLEKPVDFIRWHSLSLNPDSNTFFLDIEYGVAMQNTRGFMPDKERRQLSGSYTVSESRTEDLNGRIYRLSDDRSSTAFSFIQLNDNLFHLLTPDGRLMCGNGGWSYTLNRKELLEQVPAVLPALKDPDLVLADAPVQAVYDGRTPCAEFDREYNLNAPKDCFKLKWRLILNRDPVTHQPTTYLLKSVVKQPRRDITGNWTIQRGSPTNPDAVIYRLDPIEPVGSLSFLVGDEHVLFFLDKEGRLFTGDGEFSYTLNRKAP